MRLNGVIVAVCGMFFAFGLGCGSEAEPQVEKVEETATVPPVEESGITSAAAGDTESEAESEAADDADKPEAEADDSVEMEEWEGDGIAWKTPEPWTTEAGSGFRFATILHGDDDDAAEIAVTRFGGDVGGVPANISRWCQQVGATPPATEEEMAELLTEMEIAGQNALLAEIEGEDNLKIVAVILPDNAHDRTWFFRISGEADAVDATMPTLKRVMETVELDSDA